MRSGFVHYLPCNSYGVKCCIYKRSQEVLVDWMNPLSKNQSFGSVCEWIQWPFKDILWLSSEKLEYEVIIKVILRSRRELRDYPSTEVPWSHLECQLNSASTLGCFHSFGFLGILVYGFRRPDFYNCHPSITFIYLFSKYLIWIKLGAVLTFF